MASVWDFVKVQQQPRKRKGVLKYNVNKKLELLYPIKMCVNVEKESTVITQNKYTFTQQWQTKKQRDKEMPTTILLTLEGRGGGQLHLLSLLSG